MRHYLHRMPIARPSRRKLIMLAIFAVFLMPLVARAALYAAGNGPRSWRDADWSSTGTLPPAADDKTARVIVFTGTAGPWKGIFAVHSWVVLKPAGAHDWTRYDVVGWGNPVRTNGWPPDAVGRDFRAGFYAGRTDSGTGVELNLAGFAAVKLGWVEGVEVNLLGLVAGLDLRHPGVKLPGFGRIGVESPVATALAK